MRAVALAVDQAVVVSTPVDTGRARSNWIAILGTPTRETIDAYAPGSDGSSAGQNTTAALNAAEAVIRGYVGGSASAAIHIVNNLPYIGRLNEGSSAQAPANFVQKAVVEGIEVVSAGARLGDL